MGRLKSTVQRNFLKLGKFIYNTETREVLGRTCLSWAHIGTFYLFFFTLVGGYFAAHLAVFMAVTPAPRENITPWNFGRFAYANYPNAKLGMVAIPPIIETDGDHAILPAAYESKFEELLHSANLSNVSSHCLNRSTNYGFDTNHPCVLLHLSRVFQWSPESLFSFLHSERPTPVPVHLNITCFTEDSTPIQDGGLEWEPEGIPLTLANNDGRRSFPYRNQPNFITPTVGLSVNLTALSSNSSHSKLTITCGVNLQSLSLESMPQRQLDAIYELPTNTTITVHLNN